VQPDVRRQGVGKLLLTAAAQFGRTARAVRLTLSTEITNQGAQALYEKAGWTRQTDFQVCNLPLGL
jgi:ribosomal protein S18 acetylase RimI-like enzyme